MGLRQRLGILLIGIIVIVVLIGLNAASYVQKEKTPDNEVNPNRSSFNTGATGTQAFYSLLAETGRHVVRWQEPPSLLTARNRPAVFVIVGDIRQEFTPSETEDLLRWVANGGRLVLIDRHPPDALATTTANWRIMFDDSTDPRIYSVDPSDTIQMTDKTPASKPLQPGLVVQGVNAVQPSIFATSAAFERFGEGEMPRPRDRNDDGPPPRAMTLETAVESPSQSAPAVYLSTEGRNLLVEAPFGNGHIIFLTDPYIVSNGGIDLVDNARLAVNLVDVKDGLIAFDEYHQGFGAKSNKFLQFFAGTPVVAIFIQLGLLVVALLYSQSRRFARPLPDDTADRLSKLEYVGAMAELQQRTRAYDLAIENIYSDFRRRVTRLFGLDAIRTRADEIAARIAERTGLNARDIERTLVDCEEIIRGEPTNAKAVVSLGARIREIEEHLGIRRSGRSTK